MRLIYPSSRTAVEVAEQFADGFATSDQRGVTFAAAREAAGWTNTCCVCHGTIGLATSAAAFAVANQSVLYQETADAGSHVTDILSIAEAIWQEEPQHPLVMSACDAATASAGAVSAWAEAERAARDGTDGALRALEDRVTAAGRVRAAAVGIHTVTDVTDEQIAVGLVQQAEHTAQVTLLRDIFGNPFSWPAAAPSWLTSNAVALARQMYEIA